MFDAPSYLTEIAVELAKIAGKCFGTVLQRLCWCLNERQRFDAVTLKRFVEVNAQKHFRRIRGPRTPNHCSFGESDDSLVTDDFT